MPTNEAQFIGSIRYGSPETETKNVTLTTDQWEELKELVPKCIDSNIKTIEEYLSGYVIPYYIWLCSQDERYTKGILPTPATPASKAANLPKVEKATITG